MRKINIPIFVSHQGCPNDCIFCNQKKITGVYRKEKTEEIRGKIKSYIETTPDDAEIEISFFGGSFTGIDREEQDMYLDTAGEFFYDKRVKGIRVSTRPDYINEEILLNLKEKKVTTIELGVQSMDDDVLKLNKRGLNSCATIKAVSKIREFDFSLGLQMMVGMYGSDENNDIETAKKIIELKPDFVRIYPTVVIKETELFKLYENKKYTPYTLEKAVEICAKLLKMFEEKGIKVIRLGLMAGEEINENNVYGPYHSSFRELVESKIYYDEIAKLLKDCEWENIIIYCSKNITSKIVGNKRQNVTKLKKEFNLNSLEVRNKDMDGYYLEGK